LYEKAGKPKEALSIIDDVIKVHGNDEVLLFEKEQIYLQSNRLEKAIEVAELLIQLNPKEGRFYLNLGEIYNNSHQPRKAIEVYEKAIKLFPNEPSLQYGLANYYKSIHDTVHYSEYISKAVLNPEFDNETKVNVLVSYLQEIGLDSAKKNQGIELTSKLAEQNPDDGDITALYAQVLWNTGSHEQAAEWFKKSLAIDPNKFNVWQQLLLCYSGPKDADSLIKYSSKATKFFPNQAMLHYLNGMGHYYKKNYPTAITAINRAIDLQPEDSKALLSDMYSTLGDIYNATDEFVLSDTCLEKSLRMNPENPSVLNNYAYYLSVRGVRLADAEKMSKKSLEIRPGEATFLDTYGWIFYKEGDYQDAKKFIEDAIKADKDADGTVWEHLGDVMYKLNDVDKAVDCWKKAKEKGTDSKKIDKKIQDRKLYE
jgi:tetratricopeptide (TPR) repeat protein